MAPRRAELVGDCPRDLLSARSRRGGGSPGLLSDPCSCARALLSHFRRRDHQSDWVHFQSHLSTVPCGTSKKFAALQQRRAEYGGAIRRGDLFTRARQNKRMDDFTTDSRRAYAQYVQNSYSGWGMTVSNESVQPSFVACARDFETTLTPLSANPCRSAGS